MAWRALLFLRSQPRFWLEAESCGVVLRGIPKDLERRYQAYKPIHDDVTTHSGLARDVTIIDLDEEFITDKDADVTSLILNIASDAIIIYDPEGKLASLFERYRTKDGKYGWKPKDGILRAVEA